METTLTHEQIKHIIFSELPKIIEKDPKIRSYLLKVTKEKYADKKKTKDHVDRILDELKRDREASEKKWAENQKKSAEYDLKWEKHLEESKRDREASEQKWAEWNLKWEKNQDELKRDREASEKKWAENQKKSAEYDLKWEKHLEESKRDREASEKKWAENQKKSAEYDLKWEKHLEESKRDREASEKKWAENQKKSAEYDLKWEKHLEESKRDREASEQKWAEWNLKWEKNQDELKRDREASEQKWAEWNLKWEKDREDSEKKWAENQKAMKKLDSTIGAIGARWGMHAESAFRDGLKAILEESFRVNVERYLDFDEQGLVFGRPYQIEMDVIIYNGTLILCEIKSSLSKSDLYAFWRKTQFYEERHQRKANRKIVISPMLSPKAIAVAKELNIETYGYADEVPVGTV